MALKHLRTPSYQPGQTLRILLSWVQAYHGMSTFVWADPHLPLPPFPAPWIDGVRKALKSINGRIIIPADDPILFQKLRENDEFIMEAAMAYTDNKEAIARINSCRRYLQVITLADITNSLGTKILPEARIGNEDVFKPMVIGERFNQQRPASFAWKTWRKFLQTFEKPNGLLLTSLRDWIQPISKCRWRKPFVFHPSTGRLYKCNADGSYHHLPNMTTESFFLADSTLATPEPECYPVRAFELSFSVHIM